MSSHSVGTSTSICTTVNAWKRLDKYSVAFSGRRRRVEWLWCIYLRDYYRKPFRLQSTTKQRNEIIIGSFWSTHEGIRGNLHILRNDSNQLILHKHIYSIIYIVYWNLKSRIDLMPLHVYTNSDEIVNVITDETGQTRFIILFYV